MAAALLLLAVSMRGLFIGTVIGFILSAVIIMRLALPNARHVRRGKTWDRMTRGIRTFLATPRLRGLMALNIAAAAATAMVVVNTVVIVQGKLGMSEQAVATAMAVFGVGSVCGALLFMYLIEWVRDRALMIAGGLMIAIGLLAGVGIYGLVGLLPLWFGLGLGCALAQTPAGILICRSSRETNRQSLYAAQFALWHLCLLATYPLAGWMGAEIGLPAAFLVLGAIACLALSAATWLWPRRDGAALRVAR
jgi:predicted MFS family arabinose efflux permease